MGKLRRVGKEGKEVGWCRGKECFGNAGELVWAGGVNVWGK